MGRRKETRGEARSAELPRAPRRERHAAAGGTANGSREVAGAIAKHRKAAPEPNTPVSANSRPCGCSLRPGARAHAPTPRHCPPSGVKPSRGAEPGSRGWTFSRKSRSKQLAGAKQEEVPREEIQVLGALSLFSQLLP